VANDRKKRRKKIRKHKHRKFLKGNRQEKNSVRDPRDDLTCGSGEMKDLRCTRIMK
jgi:hypothetical protein